MAIGLCAGLGWWFLSAFVTGIALFVLTVFRLVWRSYAKPALDKLASWTHDTDRAPIHEIVLLHVVLYTHAHGQFTDALESQWCENMETLDLKVEKYDRQHRVAATSGNRVSLRALMKVWF
jgi:hypothetical protein